MMTDFSLIIWVTRKNNINMYQVITDI